MRETIVEVRGGTVVGVYSDDADLRVILVDWDDIGDRPTVASSGIIYDTTKMQALPPETAMARTLVGAAEKGP